MTIARIFLLSGAALALTACNEKNAYVPPPAPKVTVSQPAQKPVVNYIELTGTTQTIATVDLEARVQGFLEQINYKDGTLVKKDTILFVIQRNTYEAQLLQAQAQLKASEAVLLNSQGEYTRQSTLGKDQFASQAHVDDAKSKLDQAAASVDNSKASVELATINLGYTQVMAPFDGVVTRHLVSIGQLVGYAGPTKLATIVQMDPIYVYFNVSETIVLRIKEQLAREGKTVRDVHDVNVEIGLQTEEGYPHKGKVDYIAPQVDAATGTLEVRAVFENKNLSLLPGLFARVRIPVQKLDKGLLVEDAAIGSSQVGEYVLVVGKGNTVEQRRVKLGPLEGQLRVIESGLTAEDWVVINGMQRAIPGNKVDPERVPVTTATADK